MFVLFVVLINQVIGVCFMLTIVIKLIKLGDYCVVSVIDDLVGMKRTNLTFSNI